MWTPTRVAAHLAVLGAALVAAGVHGAGAAPAPAASAGAVVRYVPPPATLVAPGRPHTATRAASRPTPPARRTVPRKHAAVARAHRRPVTSFATALDAAVARIPTYRSGAARWVVSRAYDFWGTADWYHDVLYVSPDVPRDRLYDVAVHEWSHELSVLDYDGDVPAATAAMNGWFGGSGLTGPERAADCMAILQGATWTHYTRCTDAHWRAGAAALVAGHQL